MRVVVTGGRDFCDSSLMRRALSEIHRENPGTVTLICGMARGSDCLAHYVANIYGWAVEEFPADWDRHGKAAGHIRNQQMVDAKPDMCVAFPGGNGTADMVRRCKGAGIPVLRPRWPTKRCEQ